MTRVTLTPLANLSNGTTATTTINANSTTLNNTFDRVLWLDGTAPNQMQAALDMNSNQIINLPPPATMNSPARLVDVASNPTITVPPTGTSGATVPFLNGNNTWSGTNTFNNTISFPVNGNSIVGNNTGSPAAYTNLNGAQVEQMLQFTQAGTGAVQRSLDSKVKEWVSVLDFGADPTGTTANFGTAFNLAMTAATGTGFRNLGTVYIPFGFYKIGSTVPTWLPGVNIVADPGAYIQANVSIAQMLKGGIGSANSLVDVSLTGGQWDGNGNVTNEGFTLPDFNRVRLTNFRMYNCGGNSGNGSIGGFIRLGANTNVNCIDMHISNAYLVNFTNLITSIVANNYGIFADPNCTIFPSDCRFINNEIVGVQIGFQGSFFEAVFVDNHIYPFIVQGNMSNGFKLTGNTCKLIGCQVDGPIASGTAAFDFSGSGSTYVLMGCGYLETTNNNISNGVNLASNTSLTAYGNYWIGSSSSHKILGDYAGTLTGLTAQGDFEQNVSNQTAYGLFTYTGTSNSQFLVPRANLIVNGSGTFTLTLYSPATVPMGTTFTIKTVTANAVNSASSNVVPLAGGAAGTSILAATAGKWATLQSDGTNWNIIASN